MKLFSLSMSVLFSVVAVALCACGDAGADGVNNYAGPTSTTQELATCTFEYRVSYSCSDGDNDPGEWQKSGGINDESCGKGEKFHSQSECANGLQNKSEYIDGCIFKTEFRNERYVACSSLPKTAPAPTTAPTTPPTTTSPPASKPPSSSCFADVGETCAKNGDCCDYASGNAVCMAYGGSLGTRCGATCNQGSDCKSGCCVETNLGNRVCAPADACN